MCESHYRLAKFLIWIRFCARHWDAEMFTCSVSTNIGVLKSLTRLRFYLSHLFCQHLFLYILMLCY